VVDLVVLEVVMVVFLEDLVVLVEPLAVVDLVLELLEVVAVELPVDTVAGPSANVLVSAADVLLPKDVLSLQLQDAVLLLVVLLLAELSPSRPLAKHKRQISHNFLLRSKYY